MMKTGLRRLLALALGAGLLTANTYAAATTFTDVPTTYWGYYYIDRAATEGLVSGIGDNRRRLDRGHGERGDQPL